MEQVRTDSRSTRTRHLIIESFIILSNNKEFTAITVKDITEKAQINRATFYNHFLDKYDLLEKVVSEKLRLDLGCDQAKDQLPLDKTIKLIFLALAKFGMNMSKTCSSQEENETIDTIVHVHLTDIFSERLTKSEQKINPETIAKLSGLLTHSIVGLSKDFKQSKTDESPEQFIDSMISYLLYGIGH